MIQRRMWPTKKGQQVEKLRKIGEKKKRGNRGTDDGEHVRTKPTTADCCWAKPTVVFFLLLLLQLEGVVGDAYDFKCDPLHLVRLTDGRMESVSRQDRTKQASTGRFFLMALVRRLRVRLCFVMADHDE